MARINFKVTSQICSESVFQGRAIVDLTDRVGSIMDDESKTGVSEDPIREVFEVRRDGRVEYFGHIVSGRYSGGYRRLERI